MKKYLPFIKFIFYHDYYLNRKFRDANLLLYEGKEIADRNYKLVLRKDEPGTFILYIDTTGNFKERLQFLVKDLAEGEFMSFLFKSENEHIQTFTQNLEIKSNQQLIKLQLPLETGIEKVLNYQLSEIGTSPGNTVFERKILRAHPKSILYMTINTMEIDFQILQDRIESNKPFIVNIQFETKSFIWKYLFLSRNHLSPDLSVIDSKQLVSFSKVEWTESINSQPVGMSYSKMKIPFSEAYPFRLQLWKNYFNGKSLVIDDLPFPDPDHTGNLFFENKNNGVSIYQYL